MRRSRFCILRWRSIWRDRKSTRLNSSHTVIYTLSLHDALPISGGRTAAAAIATSLDKFNLTDAQKQILYPALAEYLARSEEHTSELQSHSDLHSFPTRRSSDLRRANCGGGDCDFAG